MNKSKHVFATADRQTECAAGLRSCGTTDREGLMNHCVHQSLWCDNHVNCGQPNNMDEIACLDDGKLTVEEMMLKCNVAGKVTLDFTLQ